MPVAGGGGGPQIGAGYQGEDPNGTESPALSANYSQSLGRISGGLLSDNLKNFQDGGDLAFDNDLLYLDVVNKRVGINNYGTSPTALYINGSKILSTVNLIVDNNFYNQNWTVSSNTINLSTGTMYITPNQSSNPTIVSSGVGTSDLNLTATGFTTVTPGSDIVINPGNYQAPGPKGSITWSKGFVSQLLQDGITTSQMTVTGNALVSSNLYANGTINFGDNSSQDSVSFSAELSADLNPEAGYSDTFGSSSLYWDTVYTNNLAPASLTTVNLNAGGIRVSGNSITSIDNSQDITFLTQGSGTVSLNGAKVFVGNNIQNNTVQPFDLLSTADGYFNFGGTSALAMPVGTTSQRVTTNIGTTRYNTDLQYLEIYNGTSWQNVIGSSPPTTIDVANDLGVIYDIILG